MKTRARSDGSALSWVLGILTVIVLLLVAGFWWMRANPLAVYERVTRRALAKAGLELERIDTQVGNLAYWEGGDGSTIVLLHGVGDQAGAFQGIVSSLLADHRVLIPDLPGHGDSEPTEGTLPMELVYTGVEELLAAAAPGEPVILVGHSMGAWLATIQAHRHPASVSRVILINGGALTGDRPDLSLAPVDREAARNLMAALRDPASPPTPDFVLDDIVEQSAMGPIGRVTADVGSLVAHLLDGRLSEVTVPVDLLWGESDQLMTLAYAERMAAELPRARITTISGCGHHPANECPAKLAVRLADVLAMEPPAAATEPGPEPEPFGAPIDESAAAAEATGEAQ